VYGAVDGVIRTRVGYCGGKSTNPSYYDLGGHTETIEMEFDPSKISLEDLLDIFWDCHSPIYNSSDTQYMSAIFYHDPKQKSIAEKSMAERSKKIGRSLFTKILPCNKFTLAEDYHQKFYLRQVDNFMELLSLNTDKELIDSPVATKLNAYISGRGNYTEIQKYVQSVDIPESSKLPFQKKLASVHQVIYKKPASCHT